MAPKDTPRKKKVAEKTTLCNFGTMDTRNTKESRISVKIDQILKDRVQRVEDSTGIGEPSLVRSCLVALCDYVEQNGELTIPFTVIPKSEYLRLVRQSGTPLLRVAEDPTEPRTVSYTDVIKE